jgi:hypothetical protein
LLGQNNYATLIWMALILLLASTFFSAVPAWMLDRGVASKGSPGPS